MEIISLSQISPLMTVEELAQYLKVKKSTIRQLCFKKRIPMLKIGGLVRFHKKTIDTWILNDSKIEEVEKDILHKNK